MVDIVDVLQTHAKQDDGPFSSIHIIYHVYPRMSSAECQRNVIGSRTMRTEYDLTLDSV